MIVICPKADVIPLCVAISKSYPNYSRKTGKQLNRKLIIEFIIQTQVPHGKRTQDKTPTQVCIALVRDHFILYYISQLAHINNEECDYLSSLCDSIRQVGQIVDKPCNEMDCDAFLREARTISRQTGSKITVVRGKELLDQGFGGIFNVGKAAQSSAALVVLRYTLGGRIRCFNLII